MLESTQTAQTYAKAKISRRRVFHREETYGTPLLAAALANLNFNGRIIFHVDKTYSLLV